jgi:hypothetical protein
MPKRFVFLMSVATQVAYWATMLSAFDVNFSECLCSGGRDFKAIKSEATLSVISLTPPQPHVLVASISYKNPDFCKGASDLAGPIPRNIDFLNASLMELMKRTNARLKLCIKIGADNSLTLLETSADKLSTKDRLLISNYLQSNLRVSDLTKAGSIKGNQKYNLEMEVLFVPEPRTFTE